MTESGLSLGSQILTVGVQSPTVRVQSVMERPFPSIRLENNQERVVYRSGPKQARRLPTPFAAGNPGRDTVLSVSLPFED